MGEIVRSVINTSSEGVFIDDISATRVGDRFNVSATVTVTISNPLYVGSSNREYELPTAKLDEVDIWNSDGTLNSRHSFFIGEYSKDVVYAPPIKYAAVARAPYYGTPSTTTSPTSPTTATSPTTTTSPTTATSPTSSTIYSPTSPTFQQPEFLTQTFTINGYGEISTGADGINIDDQPAARLGDKVICNFTSNVQFELPSDPSSPTAPPGTVGAAIVISGTGEIIDVTGESVLDDNKAARLGDAVELTIQVSTG